jgi:hypothetical protein
MNKVKVKMTLEWEFDKKEWKQSQDHWKEMESMPGIVLGEDIINSLFVLNALDYPKIVKSSVQSF